MAGKRNRHACRSATPAPARHAQRPTTRAGPRTHRARGWFPAATYPRPVSSVKSRQADPEHRLGWMVNHVQAGDRVAVADHEVGRSAAVEPGQPEELARGSAWPPTPARAQNALSVLGRPSARCLRLPIRTAAVRATPQAGTTYTALEEASRPCDPGPRRCQSSMASEGARGTKTQTARNTVAGKASLPGRPGAWPLPAGPASGQTRDGRRAPVTRIRAGSL